MRRALIDCGLLLVAALVAALQFGALALLFGNREITLIALIAAVTLTTPLHYGLMHETMHGNLFRAPGWNRAVGRLLGIALCLPWETMRFGHLAHHSSNRHKFDRPEYLAPKKSFLAAAVIYYPQLAIGNALIYALLPFLIFLPLPKLERLLLHSDGSDDGLAVRTAAWRSFSNPARRRAAQADILAIMLFSASAIIFWGRQWWVFAACVFARWCVLSLLDNAPHYAMPLNSGLEARNTHLPAILRWLILNQNYHCTHHHAPGLHWTELPSAFRQSALPHNGSWIAAVLRQFRGPVALS